MISMAKKLQVELVGQKNHGSGCEQDDHRGHGEEAPRLAIAIGNKARGWRGKGSRHISKPRTTSSKQSKQTDLQIRLFHEPVGNIKRD